MLRIFEQNVSKMKVNQTLWLVLEDLQADFKTKLDLDFRLKKNHIENREHRQSLSVFVCLFYCSYAFLCVYFSLLYVHVENSWYKVIWRKQEWHFQIKFKCFKMFIVCWSSAFKSKKIYSIINVSYIDII